MSPGVPSGGESRGVLGEEEDSQAGDDQPPHCSLSDCGLEVVWRDWRVPLSSCPPTSSSNTPTTHHLSQGSVNTQPAAHFVPTDYKMGSTGEAELVGIFKVNVD